MAEKDCYVTEHAFLRCDALDCQQDGSSHAIKCIISDDPDAGSTKYTETRRASLP